MINLLINLFLSGGLSLDNLSNINMIKDNEMLYGLDLNNKFEKSPGLKDKEKIDKLFNLDLKYNVNSSGFYGDFGGAYIPDQFFFVFYSGDFSNLLFKSSP